MAPSAQIENHFGRVAKRSPTTPVGNLIKSLLYSKGFSTEATQWGTNHENKAKQQYLEYLRSKGHSEASIKESGLVVEPGLQVSHAVPMA